MSQRSSGVPRAAIAAEAKAHVLSVLCVLMLFLYMFVPARWVGLGVLLLAMSTIGFRIEVAIRSLRKD